MAKEAAAPPPIFTRWFKFPKPLALVQAAVAELVGMMFFVLIGGLAVASTSNATFWGDSQISGVSKDVSRLIIIGFGYGFGLMLAVSSAAGVSGGHINPAVTLTLLAVGLVDFLTAAVYICAQLVGAIFGGGLIVAITPSIIHDYIGVTTVAHSITAGQGVLAELLLTAILVYTIFATAVDPRGPNTIAPLLIGISVLVDNVAGVPLTGASMNPARTFGPAVWTGVWTDQWVYWVGPILGALIVGVSYTFVHLVPLKRAWDKKMEEKDEEKV
eukprot:TRINITY_DN69973_c0_g1_i1.p1 TRINITY_DN69973_c0_g1~~TRINITY_DN69973_c0_g1_i1.p1  ORF type:complete len:308 (-),score=9.72 TRINITY_DN69973_c0_g1_i1:89-904(-)